MTDWRTAARSYYGHHFGCRMCIGAGQQPGVLQRCEDGAALWLAYQDQPLPPEIAGRVRPGGGVLGGNFGGKSPPIDTRRNRF